MLRWYNRDNFSHTILTWDKLILCKQNADIFYSRIGHLLTLRLFIFANLPLFEILRRWFWEKIAKIKMIDLSMGGRYDLLSASKEFFQLTKRVPFSTTFFLKVVCLEREHLYYWRIINALNCICRAVRNMWNTWPLYPALG